MIGHLDGIKFIEVVECRKWSKLAWVTLVSSEMERKKTHCTKNCSPCLDCYMMITSVVCKKHELVVTYHSQYLDAGKREAVVVVHRYCIFVVLASQYLVEKREVF